jgi:ribonuclease P protein component
MIERQHRFHGHSSLKAVYGRGLNVRGGPISLKYAVRDTNKPYRAAIVVSRKVHKSAVVRNRIRRRLYEIVRQAQTSLRPGGDFVFTIYDQNVATMESEALILLVMNLLEKSGGRV